MPSYRPINYFSYNNPSYYACAISLILFFIFFVILFRVFNYELLNAKNVCYPTYYYGQSCSNTITNTLQLDSEFVSAKEEYYRKAKQYKRSLMKDGAKIGIANEQIETNMTSNANFAETSIQQIQDATSLIQELSSKYLGNLQQFLKNTSNESDTNIQELSTYLTNLQSQINQTILQPTFAKYTDPLQKLYQSLLTITPNSQ